MPTKVYVIRREPIKIITGARVINTGGGGGVQSVTGDGVDNTDPLNPVLSFPTPSDIGAPSGSGTSTGTNTGDQDLSGLQPLLVSGTNIKTVGGTSLLGTGDIPLGGGETFERRHEFTGTYSYMAYAPEGSIDSAGVWIITRINVAPDGTTTKGTATGAWTNRASLTYT